MNISFNSKAASYEQNALVQKTASEVLLGLMSIKDGEDVLDLGCGSGSVTRKIALLTRGMVVGVDNSDGMINEAVRNNCGQTNLSHLVKDAGCLGFINQFDVIFCNSVFQWFQNPKKVLEQCYTALKSGGRMGIQAPATAKYCPTFVAAEAKVRTDSATRETFSCFNRPWFFGDSAEEYRQIFEDCGFNVVKCELIEESNKYSADQVYKIYQSGAENGFLNQSFYTVPLTDAYIETFRMLVKEAIKEQSDEFGMVDLKFIRIYLVAKRII